jgi:hypothetical protein
MDEPVENLNEFEKYFFHKIYEYICPAYIQMYNEKNNAIREMRWFTKVMSNNAKFLERNCEGIFLCCGCWFLCRTNTIEECELGRSHCLRCKKLKCYQCTAAERDCLKVWN